MYGAVGHAINMIENSITDNFVENRSWQDWNH